MAATTANISTNPTITGVQLRGSFCALRAPNKTGSAGVAFVRRFVRLSHSRPILPARTACSFMLLAGKELLHLAKFGSQGRGGKYDCGNFNGEIYRETEHRHSSGFLHFHPVLFRAGTQRRHKKLLLINLASSLPRASPWETRASSGGSHGTFGGYALVAHARRPRKSSRLSANAAQARSSTISRKRPTSL